jgi:hypothetical protein
VTTAFALSFEDFEVVETTLKGDDGKPLKPVWVLYTPHCRGQRLGEWSSVQQAAREAVRLGGKHFRSVAVVWP